MTGNPRWRSRPISDLVDVLDGQRVPVSAKERTNRRGAVPYYGATGQVGWIDSHLFDEELVLLGEDGVQFFDPNKPKAYRITGRAWVNNHAHVLRPLRSHIDGRYLTHYLNQIDYRGLANGTTRLKLTQSAMRRINVSAPDVEEQQRIVDILEDHLSRLDAGDATLARSLRRIDTLTRQALELTLTGDTTFDNGRAGHLDAAGVDDGYLRSLPSGWHWRRLHELADVVGGVTKDAKRQSDPTFVEVPYLRVANVQRGHLDLDHVTTIRVSPAKADGLRLVPGDVLLNEGGDRDKLGRGWVWEGQIEKCIHQNHVFRARVRDAAIDPRLLSWSANTFGGPWCERNGKQSVNLASISLSRIKLMPVPVPPTTLQPLVVARIEDQLSAMVRLKASLDEALLRSATLRRALLQAAFSGQLIGRSSDLDRAAELVDS